jgi:hypothetical protein
VARDGIEAFVFVLGCGIAGFRGVRERSSMEWLVLEEHSKFLGIYNDCKLRLRGCDERKALQQCRGVAIMSTKAQWLRSLRSVRKGNSMNNLNNHWSDSKLAGCPLITSTAPCLVRLYGRLCKTISTPPHVPFFHSFRQPCVNAQLASPKKISGKSCNKLCGCTMHTGDREILSRRGLFVCRVDVFPIASCMVWLLVL